MVREEGWSSLGRGVGPNVFRAILARAHYEYSVEQVRWKTVRTEHVRPTYPRFAPVRRHDDKRCELVLKRSIQE